MTPERRRQLLRLGGWLLAGAALLFVALAARRRWADIAAIRLDPAGWLEIAGMAALYGAALPGLALAWHCLLRLVDAAPADPALSLRGYCVSQLAKYVPGNVFHLVGRHMLLRAAGLPDRRLALASLLEAGMMLAAAGAVVLAGLAAAPATALRGLLLPLGTARVPLLALAGAGTLALALAVALRLSRGQARWALAALALYLLFFAGMGAMIVALAGLFAPVTPLAAIGAPVAAGGVGAWMAGYATPGAPAGLGTREAAMLLLVGGAVPPGALLVTAALFRLVTLAGDVVCFALGSVLFRPR